MANITKGSQTSQYPDALPDFTAQTETNDLASEDATLAEARDANKWSAEVRAIAESIGTGGRAQVSVSGSTATIETLEYVYHGTQTAYAGTTTLSLFAGQVNYIYIDMADNTAKVSTSGWLSTPHLRLAVWDDSGASAVLTDKRPHDLKPAATKMLAATTAAQVVDSGSTTITSGNTEIAIAFNVTFSALPVFVCASKRPADGTQRTIDFSNLTTTGAKIKIDTAAPVAGADVHWMAVGIEDTSGTGSGS